ncbi:MAG: flagellin [Aquabacterium sp.]|jgi:flagellin|uniref:flagellin N-terminal helical domain-containing protein n=1 Tax=Aquabacterium sp. TaxID=1872578 RepID=UPI002A35A0CE|nr:flagellin [Aquabacterium sp.]MDX9845048.1 flagellin [Aquabacterium sp.]
MAQTINTNLNSLNAQRNMSTSQSSLATSMQRLSSGLRVNSAKDDAAGLAIAERMSAQVRGMNVAVRNSNDAISYAQTAEGALGKMGDSLQRMRELAVQSRNATNSTGDQANLQKEFRQLQEEIKRTMDGAKFNGQKLFESTAATTIEFQVGANTTSDDRIGIERARLTGGTVSAASAATAAAAADDLILATVTGAWSGGASATGIAIGGVGAVTAGSTVDNTAIDAAIQVIDTALNKINDKRAVFGAAQNRFEAVVSNLAVNIENQSAARGRIMDADFASETANLSRAQILQQAGNAMIAQANQLPQQVLRLLQ